MAFQLTASDVTLVDGHLLQGNLRNEAGESCYSEIDLDQFIGNENGTFQWGASNFSHSAENCRVDIEGEYNQCVLRATLRDLEGNGYDRDVNLGERIENRDGVFVFVE